MLFFFKNTSLTFEVEKFMKPDSTIRDVIKFLNQRGDGNRVTASLKRTLALMLYNYAEIGLGETYSSLTPFFALDIEFYNIYVL